MNIVDRREGSDNLTRGPHGQGLRSGTVTVVHKSMVEIGDMRLSIEHAHLEISRSWNAVLDSWELLDRLRREGF